MSDNRRATCFVGGSEGSWEVMSMTAPRGAALADVSRLAICSDSDLPIAHLNVPLWMYRGAASHVRYVERDEKTRLQAAHAPLGRAGATRAAMILIQKSDAWWDLTQDERRRIFEAQSGHISGSMKYLPMIARQLYHSRDLGEPFDFITWFEFDIEHAALFDELVDGLRRSEEWRHVTREVDLRLSRRVAA